MVINQGLWITGYGSFDSKLRDSRKQKLLAAATQTRAVISSKAGSTDYTQRSTSPLIRLQAQEAPQSARTHQAPVRHLKNTRAPQPAEPSRTLRITDAGLATSQSIASSISTIENSSTRTERKQREMPELQRASFYVTERPDNDITWRRVESVCCPPRSTENSIELKKSIRVGNALRATQNRQ